VAWMKILSIDGNNVVGKDKKAVVAVMKTISGAVPFVLAKPEPGAKLPKTGSVKKVEPKVEVPVTRLGGETSGLVRVSLSPPLGLSIGGDATSGVSITKVNDAGAAKDSGQVEVGMKIISVDGVSMVGKDKKAVVVAFKGLSGPAIIELQKPGGGGGAGSISSVLTVSLTPPLGLSVNGTETAGIFVTRLKPGSALDSGKITKGMKLLSVGSTDITGKDKATVVRLIKSAKGSTLYGFKDASTEFAAFQSSTKAAKTESIRIASPHLKKEVGGDAVASKSDGTTPFTVSIALPLGLKFEMSPAAKGIIVVSMKKSSNAAKTGKPLVGMKVLAINDVPITAKHTKKEVNAMIKASNEATKLKFQFEETGADFVKEFKATTKGSGKKMRRTEDVVVTVKLAPPLGLSIAGNADSGIFVTKVKDTGSAASAGTVKVGMRIGRINGKSCDGLEKQEVVVLMKAMKGSTEVEFVVDADGFAAFQSVAPGRSRSSAPAVSAQPTSVADDSPIYDNGEGDEPERKSSMYDNDEAGDPLYDNGEGAEQESTYDNERDASGSGATDISTMGRLKIIKMLKAKNIDYSEIDSSDINALRALAAAVAGP